MRHKLYILLVLIMLICMLVGCNNRTTIGNDIEDSNQVHLWTYSFEVDGNYMRDYIISSFSSYSKENKIDLIIHQYTSDELSFKNYLFKRNLAIESGKVDLCLDCISTYEQIENKAIDYASKLKNYSNLIENLKGYSCIPVALTSRCIRVSRDILDKYNVTCSNFIDIEEYLDIKQYMKDNGANFKLNYPEYKELQQYYLMRNGVGFNNDKDIDEDILLRCIEDIYTAITKEYDEKKILEHDFFRDKYIVDKCSNEGIYKEIGFCKLCAASRQQLYKDIDYYDEYVFFIDNQLDSFRSNSENYGIFMSGEANEGAIKIVDYFLGESYQMSLYDSFYDGFIIDTNKFRTHIGIDEKFNYIGKETLSPIKERIFINACEKLINDTYYDLFNSTQNNNSIKSFVEEIIRDSLKNGFDKEKILLEISDFVINQEIKL